MNHPSRLRCPVIFALLLAALAGVAQPACAAPAPTLTPLPPNICNWGDWQPSLGDIERLEKALGPYFEQSSGTTLPATGIVYDRQYSGYERNGRKVITGHFYPATKESRTMTDAGECWITADGGSKYWTLSFDVQNGSVVNVWVNGRR